MTHFEKLRHIREDLDEVRKEIAAMIARDEGKSPDLVILHERVSKAIKALSGQG